VPIVAMTIRRRGQEGTEAGTRPGREHGGVWSGKLHPAQQDLAALRADCSGGLLSVACWPSRKGGVVLACALKT